LGVDGLLRGALGRKAGGVWKGARAEIEETGFERRLTHVEGKESRREMRETGREGKETSPERKETGVERS
jgi:hypothetical protein